MATHVAEVFEHTGLTDSTETGFHDDKTIHLLKQKEPIGKVPCLSMVKLRAVPGAQAPDRESTGL